MEETISRWIVGKRLAFVVYISHIFSMRYKPSTDACERTGQSFGTTRHSIATTLGPCTIRPAAGSHCIHRVLVNRVKRLSVMLPKHRRWRFSGHILEFEQ